MFMNYLKVFTRLLHKQHTIALINVVGLAVALGSCMVIALYVRHELSFDRFFTNAEELYRVNMTATEPTGQAQERANTFFPIAPLLADNLPGIAAVARYDPHVSLIRVGEETFYENEFKLVDPAFFQMFDVVWLEGDLAAAYTGPTDVVVSRSFADKYFGDAPALGQSLEMSEGPVLRVTGVVEDLPLNTHLSGTVFASTALREVLGIDMQRQWFDAGYYTYVQLQPGTDLAQLEQSLDTLAQTSIPSSGPTRFTLDLMPVTAIHLDYTLGDWPGKPSGDPLTITVFVAIGVGILLVACANFINLSTARASQRFREVGLRLTLGARRSQVLGQYLGESVLMVLLAIVLALVLVELISPAVQALLQLNLAFDNLTDPLSLLALLTSGLVLGLLAGWYPALLMSAHKPAAALKDPSHSPLRGLALRNLLVVFQFSLAIAILVGSAVIWLQLRFASALDLGYDSDQVVHVVLDDRLDSLNRAQLLKQRMQQNSGIAAAALSGFMPDRVQYITTASAEGSDMKHQMGYSEVDTDYLALYDIALLAGRLPSADRPGDFIRATSTDAGAVSGSVVLNESAVRQFGWTLDEALGKRVLRYETWVEVVGIVQDTIESVRSPARPIIYAVPQDQSEFSRLSVKLGEVSATDGIALIERIWSEVNPGEPLTSIFMSELLAARYQQESKLQGLAFLFAGTAIAISCMGLFGLASLNAQQRTKEIGVRKVMGGSVWQIVLLLTNDFSKLVLVANVIAWPFAWVAMQRWLEQFAYRIDLAPLIFIGSGLIALCVAWVTVGGTVAKAACQRPVLALRYE